MKTLRGIVSMATGAGFAAVIALSLFVSSASVSTSANPTLIANKTDPGMTVEKAERPPKEPKGQNDAGRESGPKDGNKDVKSAEGPSRGKLA